MQNTSSQRRADGRFGASDAPKAKPIQVWLQPKTIELLDTLTKQWGVGRGKVIDQLLTRGPVPPESWQQVAEESKPTDSGPSKPKRRAKAKAKPAAAAAPKPEPTDVGPVDDWEEKEPELEPQAFQVGDRVQKRAELPNGSIGKVVFHAVRYDRAKKRKRHQYDVVWSGLSTGEGAMQEELVPAGPTDGGRKEHNDRLAGFHRSMGIDPDDPSKNLDGSTRKKRGGLRLTE